MSVILLYEWYNQNLAMIFPGNLMQIFFCVEQGEHGEGRRRGGTQENVSKCV